MRRTGKRNEPAFRFARTTRDIIDVIDADGLATPGEIPKFVTASLDGANFAKGACFVESGGSSDITRLRSFGSCLLAALSSLMLRMKARFADSRSYGGIMSGDLCRRSPTVERQT